MLANHHRKRDQNAIRTFPRKRDNVFLAQLHVAHDTLLRRCYERVGARLAGNVSARFHHYSHIHGSVPTHEAIEVICRRRTVHERVIGQLLLARGAYWRLVVFARCLGFWFWGLSIGRRFSRLGRDRAGRLVERPLDRNQILPTTISLSTTY